MRLYLLPISTHRTLLYCQRLNQTLPTPTNQLSTLDKLTDRAARTWASWEKKQSGWQRMTVEWGNKAFRQIPHEEWGLKSLPPLSNRRRSAELDGSDPVEVVYPASIIGRGKRKNESGDEAKAILRRLGTERQSLHYRRMIWSLVGMPISAPIGIIPLVPNLPFFYLVYRAWSHWRAVEGGKHIEFLLDKNLLSPAPSQLLDSIYASHSLPSNNVGIRQEKRSTEQQEKPLLGDGEEMMLITQEKGQRLAQKLDCPALEIELERAIWQVENAVEEKRVKKEVAAAAAGGSKKNEKTP